MKNQLTLPQRDKKNLEFCEHNPEAIAGWLKQLPGTNALQTCKDLTFALNDITRLDIEPDKVYPLVEQLRHRAIECANTIFQTQLQKSLVFDTQQQEYFQSGSALFKALVSAYKSVLQNCLDKKRQDDLLAKSCHRAVADSGNFYLFSCLLFRPAATRLWFELHSLYRIAEQLKILDFTQPDDVCDQKRQLSVADFYKQVLLMSRSRFNQLSHEEIRQIWNALKLWAPHCKITKTTGLKTYFAVNLKSDDAMHYAAPDPDKPVKGMIGLDTHILNAHLKKLQAKDSTEALSPALINHLASAWSQISKRKYQRKEQTSDCQICPGFSAIHYQLSGKKELRDIVAPYSNENSSKKSAFDLDKNDVWSEVRDADKKNRRRPEAKADDSVIQFYNNAPSTDNPLYAPMTAKIINSSAGGYCLEISHPAPGKFHIGDPLILNESTNERPHWLLGVIRWMEILSDGMIKIGVELLSAQAEACAIAHVHKTREMKHFQRCLLLPEVPAIAQHSSLIMPRLGVKPGQKFRLLHKQTIKSGQLMKCVSSTAVFVEHQYRLLES